MSTTASSEPKKRQQGFAVAATNAGPSHPPATYAISPGFASGAVSSSYIDTSYLLDDEMWKTMTVNTDMSESQSPHPPQMELHNHDSDTADADMADLAGQMEGTKSGGEAQPAGSHDLWENGLQHLDDWLGLPPWTSTVDIAGAPSAITSDKASLPSEPRAFSVSEDNSTFNRAGCLRSFSRLDGSPFTESSLSAGESMSSSEQTTSVQSTGTVPRGTQNSVGSSVPTTEKIGSVSAVASAASKSKRNRSLTSASTTAAPQSVSAILESSRTGRTAASGTSSARRAVSANGRGDRETKRSVSTERATLSRDSCNGGSVGKAIRIKTGKIRRQSIAPAMQSASSGGSKVGTTGPLDNALHIDTATAAMTMSTGPQTFGGIPTMAWSASPWPAGVYPPPQPHWSAFASGGMPYGTFPPGWPMWGHPHHTMAMHPAWSLPMNGGTVVTPSPGSIITPSWPPTADATGEGSLSPGCGQSISLPITSSMQSIFSSMQGLHVGTGEVAREQEGVRARSTGSDRICAPFQPSGQGETWPPEGGPTMTNVGTGAVDLRSPSVTFQSASHPNGPSGFSWSMEDIAPKSQTELAAEYSPGSADGQRCPSDQSHEGADPRQTHSTSISPPPIEAAGPSNKMSSSPLPERSNHHRKASRSLNRATSLRGSKLEDVPEGETVDSHKAPLKYSRIGVSTSGSPQSPPRAETAVDPMSRSASDKKNTEGAIKSRGGDGKKENAAEAEEEDDEEDEHLLDGEDDEADDVDDEDEAQEDGHPSSRKPARLRASGSGRPVRSEQERRKRRRESHNLVERRRRDTINERIAELASLLPEAMLIDAIAHSQGGGNNSKVVQVAIPEEMLSKLNSAGRHEMGGGSTLDILSLASAPANSETLALAQARPNKGIILRKSVDYIRALQEFIEQQGKHARMLREEVERVTGLLEESKEGKHERLTPGVGEQSEMKRLWPTAHNNSQVSHMHPSGGTSQQSPNRPAIHFRPHSSERGDEQGVDGSSSCGSYPQLEPGQSPPPTLAEWLAAAQRGEQPSLKMAHHTANAQ